MTEPVRREIGGHAFFAAEETELLFGYSSGEFPSTALKLIFPGLPLLLLKQIHSVRIAAAAEWHGGMEADGLLLERSGIVAVIQTADCLPLFFFDDERRRGGVLHIGWRGLQQGIEEKLAGRLGKTFSAFSFFMGPAIEKKCFEVGEEVLRQFAAKKYAGEIFSPASPGKYFLDLKQGVKLSLQALGASADRIADCGQCTRCSPEFFPSYRRDGATGRRIFNFLVLGKRVHPDSEA